MNATRLIDTLAPLLSKIPMVERPKGRVPLETKLAFTLAILILYFALSTIPLFGLSPESLDLFGRWRAIFAGERFSLTALGVMPIINASIMVQLFMGLKIMKLDLTNHRDQALYLNVQKLLVLCFVLFTSVTYTAGFYMPNPAMAAQLGVSLRFISFLLFLQVFIGGMLIYYMEEVVSRWGIGSGVGLFIVAGISQHLITCLISPIRIEGWAVGVIPRWVDIVSGGYLDGIFEEGVIFLFRHHVIALVATVSLFFIVVYLACARIELRIPGYLKRRRGSGRIRVPITFVHFIYPIVIPLTFLNLGRILQANIQGFGRMCYSCGITMFGMYDEYGTAVSGLMYYLDPIYSPWDWFPGLMIMPHAGWEVAVKIASDMSLMVVGAMISALLWLKVTPGMEAKDIRSIMRNSGLPVYRYSRGAKAIKRAVDRCTPKIALLSSGILGALFVIANMFGTLGATGAASLFLCVMVIYGIHDEIATERSYWRDILPLR